MANSPPAVEVQRLTKVYKTTRAVDGIDFALAPGSITGLLGGNGAGKTTTIAMIMGLVTPTSGSVRVLGADMPRQRYRVLHRMNFESPYVDMPMRLTVRQNLKVFGMIYAVPDLTERIKEIAAQLDLVDLLDREILLLKPPVEMPDQAELDPAVDPRIAVGCQPRCEQIDVPR